MNLTHNAMNAVFGLTLLLSTGCGGGGASSTPSGGTGGGLATGGATGSGGANGNTGGTMNLGNGGATTTGGATGSGGTVDAGATSCAAPDAWDVTYDLDGSTFEIRDTPAGIGDQVNTCTAPYTANDEIGPGTMVIRFADGGGAPAAGPVHIMSYDMSLEFTVATLTTAHTDMKQESVAGTCGAASGTYTGSTIHFDDPGLVLHTFGNVTCTGSLCTAAGLPDGVPQPSDDTAPQALSDFAVTNGVRNVAMPAVLNSKDDTSSEWMTIKGTETGRKPVCNCN